jgi:hypothetical protein
MNKGLQKDPLARASSFPRAGGGGGCCWCHKKKPGWPGVAVLKIPPQVPLTPGRGLVGGSSDRRDGPVFSDGRPGARSRRDTKRSDWHPRVQPGRVLSAGCDALNLWLLRDLRYLEDAASGIGALESAAGFVRFFIPV